MLGSAPLSLYCVWQWLRNFPWTPPIVWPIWLVASGYVVVHISYGRTVKA